MFYFWKRTALVAVLIIALNVMAKGDSFSFAGSFERNNDLQLFEISIDDPGTVTIRTLSYAGGVNASRIAVARGGFDPVIVLFDQSGNFIDSNDDGIPDYEVPIDPDTGEAFDSYLEVTLDPGAYIIGLTQSPNFNLGDLSQGFIFTNDPDFAGGFPDFDGRRSNWALDVLGVDRADVNSPTAVPEPTSLALLMTGLAGAAFTKKTRGTEAPKR